MQKTAMIPFPVDRDGCTPAKFTAQIRRTLKSGGSDEHAKGVQWFFKEEVKSCGWYTADLRRAALRCRREISREYGLAFLIEVADNLFAGSLLEEKIVAVFLLEKLDGEFGNTEFKRFDSWLDRVSTWADRCVGALSDFADGSSEAGARKTCGPLGKIRQPLAAESGMRGADSRGQGENVFHRRYKAIRLIAR